MKTIKIIDLLNKIAKGEEVPKKIKYEGKEFEYNEYQEDYFNKEYMFGVLDKIRLFSQLNNEVEIIEEEQDIEKIKWDDKSKYEYAKKINEMLMHRTEQLKKALNEVIDTLNELKKNER